MSASQTSDVPTLLVKIFGKDRPGITAGLFDTLAAYSVDVVDIEQVVTRGRIVLCALVTMPVGGTEGELRATVHSWAESLKMQAEILSGTGDNRPRGSGRSHVTVLGHPLTAESTAAIAARITGTGGNIDRIFRLAKYPVTAVEFAVSGAETEPLRTALATAAAQIGVDVAVVSAGLHRRAQRLVVMDVDSTLIQDEVIELFAAHAGFVRPRSRRSPSGRCAGSSTSSSRCTPGSRCSRGWTPPSWTRCVPRCGSPPAPGP